jgi:hypothetical protein
MGEITDHDLILEMRGDIKLLQADVREIKDSQSKKLDDHEERIRFIERWVWGAVAVLYVANVIFGFYIALHH